MPSAITVYSLPAQLGRRGTTAVAVIALHIVLAIGLITAMALQVTPKQPEPAIPFRPIPAPHTEPHAPPAHDGDWRQPLPAVPAVPVDFDDVVGPQAPVQQVPTALEPVVIEPRFISQVRVLHDTAPLYPAAERRLQHEGVVTLRVRVGPNGRAEEVEIAKSSGHTRLDEAALAAVRRWIFAPAQTATGPVDSWVTLTVRFELTS